jgi:molybdopterin molybdotransferase
MEFITVEEAREAILSRLEPVGIERLFLNDAAGRHVAEAIEAPEDSPRFDNSSRDGYALRWSDVAEGDAELEVVGEAAAGAPLDRIVEPGEAARIMTGASVPEGADTVVMQEHCERLESGRVVASPPEAGRGAWIRKAGAFMEEGERLLEPGDRLEGPEIGMLASFRRSRFDVYRRPRVAVVSSGDELVDLDREPGSGEIVDSNAHLLETLIRRHGGEPVVLPTAPDEREATRQCFESAVEAADLVLSSGGVSVGTHDLVRDVVEAMTGGMDFWKIRMKPGKPLAFGTTRGERGVPLLGLPGNPNSCFVCFHQFVRPAMRVLQGEASDEVAPRRLSARLSRSVSSTPVRRQYLAGTLRSEGDGLVFEPRTRQNSGNLQLFVGADAFGRVPEGVEAMGAGESIEVEPIPE